MAVWSTGLELILNACEGALQIAVTYDEKPLCFQEWRAPKRAAETLVPALKNIFSALGTSPAKLKRIACMRGPGSFTGIRLVLSTAAAFRRISQARLAGLDYLQALAASAVIWRGLPYGAKIFVLTRARRDSLHFMEYVSYGPQIPPQPASELTLIPPQKARAEIGNQPCCVCGSALAKFPLIFNDPHPDMANPSGPAFMPGLVNPGLKALCLLARHGDYFPKDLEPLYARSCDAADKLPEISTKNGGDPVAAVRKLTELLSKDPISGLQGYKAPYPK